MADSVIGIDFGTSNCSVSIYSKKRGLEVLPISNHVDPNLKKICDGALFPSKFGLSNDSTYKFGGEIVDCDRDLIWDNSKRLLQYNIPIFRGGFHKKPIWAALGIFAGIFFELKKLKINTSIPCIISVPANSYSLQRSLTKIAAQTIGFNVVQLISEPCAAALGIVEKFETKKNILIVDIGGGTTDIALLKNNDGVVKEIGVAGLKRFGGLNIDQKIYKHVRKNFESTSDAEELLMRDLCENAKIDLSYNKQTVVNFKNKKISISRSQLEDWISEDVDTLVRTIRSLIDQNGFELKDIDVVVPIGGTSNIPFIRKTLKNLFKNKYFNTSFEDSLVAVSKGSAQAAAIKLKIIKDFHFNQCLEHSVGLKVFKGSRDNLVFSPILSKGQPFPAKNVKTFFSQSRKAVLTILESTSEDLLNNDTQVVLSHEIDTGDVDVNVEISYDDDGKITINTQSIEKGFLREKDLLFDFESDPDQYINKVKKTANEFNVAIKIDNISYIDSKIGDKDLLVKWAEDFLNRENNVYDFKSNFKNFISKFRNERIKVDLSKNEQSHLKKYSDIANNDELWNILVTILRKILQNLFKEYEIDNRKILQKIVNEINLTNTNYKIFIPRKPLNDSRWMVGILLNLDKVGKILPNEIEDFLVDLRSILNAEYHGENVIGDIFIDSKGDDETVVEGKIIEGLYSESEKSPESIAELSNSLLKLCRGLNNTNIFSKLETKRYFDSIYDHLIYLYTVHVKKRLLQN